MSNQLQITGAAKVRGLEGVLTGTSGVLSSVPLGGANGVATLDSSGKVPVSQLPASVVTYLGTWNAATNTPTLTNGVGDAGDLYICNVAGTVNFGAGPITFAVGDWVIYGSGTWQKSSGQNGTVTSVAMSVPSGLSVTGSPITTAGTLAVSLASGYTIPLSTQLVPTGGTTGQILAKNSNTAYDTAWIDNYANWTEQLRDTVKASVAINKGQAVYISGANGTNQLVSLASNVSEATSSKTLGLAMQNFAINDIGQIITEGLLGGLDTSSATAGDPVWLGVNGNLIFGLANKPVAPAHLVYIGVVTRANVSNGEIYVKIQNGFELNELHNVLITSPTNGDILEYDSATSLWKNVTGTTTNIAEGTNLYYTDARARGAISLTTSGTSGAATYNSTTGVLNVPNYGSALSGYVPYTGATTDVNLGYRSISASNINIDGYSFGDGGAINFKQFTSLSLAGNGYTSIGANSTNILTFGFNQGALNLKGFKLDVAGLSTNVWRTYTMPNSSGTLALTSDIPSLSNYVDLTSAQTISGIKTFSNEAIFNNGVTLNGGYITYKSGIYNLTLNTNLLTANRNVFLQDKAGTIALTSDLTGGTVTSVGLSSATSGVLS